ncbi:MAG: hypothetical protein ACK5M1_03340 [Xanthomarina gelatinilytica]|uniref:hypothetical protein n=1 Tax=Xanthomarina gelatinilytica TaxID=1137281 RepID=UPI003A8A4509
MKERENKQLEKLVEDVMKQSALESPSYNFTANVMQHITAGSKSTTTVYKPLISKTGWIVLALCVLTVMIYMLLSGDSQNRGWFHSVDFSMLSSIKMPILVSGLNVSHTTLYALLFLGIMVCVQIPILKNYFDKRLSF